MANGLQVERPSRELHWVGSRDKAGCPQGLWGPETPGALGRGGAARPGVTCSHEHQISCDELKSPVK